MFAVKWFHYRKTLTEAESLRGNRGQCYNIKYFILYSNVFIQKAIIYFWAYMTIFNIRISANSYKEEGSSHGRRSVLKMGPLRFRHLVNFI